MQRGRVPKADYDPSPITAPPGRCVYCDAKLSIYRGRHSEPARGRRGEWEDRCAACIRRDADLYHVEMARRNRQKSEWLGWDPGEEDIVSGTAKDFKHRARKMLAEAGYQEVSHGTGNVGSGHYTYENALGDRVTLASSPRDMDSGLQAIRQRITQNARLREQAKEVTVVAPAVAVAGEELDYRFKRFANHLCDLYGVGEDEAKHITMKLGAELRIWRDREKILDQSFMALDQSVRQRARKPDARIQIIESGRGNRPSIIEVRGKNYGAPDQNGHSPTDELDALAEHYDDTLSATPTEPVETPQDVAFSPMPEPVAPKGTLIEQIASMLDKSERVDEAEAKAELAKEELVSLAEATRLLHVHVAELETRISNLLATL